MLKLLQKSFKFHISRFQAAAQSLKQSQKQQWTKQITQEQKNTLWSLYKQATQGYNMQMPYWSTSIKNPSTSRLWSEQQGRSKQQAEQDYIKMVKNVLQKNGAQKYIKDF